MASNRGVSPGRLAEARVPLTKERSQERELTPTMSRGPMPAIPAIDENASFASEAEAQVSPPPKPIPFRHLWKYATPAETWQFRLGMVAGIIAGLQGPAMSFFMKDLVGALFEPDPVTRREAVTRVFIIFMAIGLGAWILTTVGVSCFIRVADSMSMRLRVRFFGHLMDKDVGWYDTHSTTEMSTRLTQDTYDLRLGIGVKFSLFVSNTCQAPIGMIVAFYRDWKLTLCLIVVLPVIAVVFGFAIKIMTTSFQNQSQFYARAGGRAESTLSSITTVAAFAGYRKEIMAYDETLAEAERDGIKAGLAAGIAGGASGLVFNCIFAMGLWLGALFMISSYKEDCWDEDTGSVAKCFNGSTMLSVLLAILSGGFGMTISFTQLGVIAVARVAAARIYAIIEEPSAFSQNDPNARQDLEIKGNINFEAVKFFYPSRKEVWALSGISFDIPAGHTAAFVGPSGSGKSTTIGLLMRFYDPQHGVVKIDGVDIRDLNLCWMRTHFSLVQQEPILFSGTIMENILYGKIGSTEEEAKEAAKKANAHNFIEEFADKYNTLVGERGSALSGGQKQRVAIARAIIRKPHVLMLDEATSALDTESERIVKKALDDIVLQGRHTTLVVAHRLSTVKDANVIFVLEDGFLIEKGTHQELVQLEDGLYKQLAEMQELAGADDLSSQELVSRIGREMSRTMSRKQSRTIGDRTISQQRTVSRSKSGSEFTPAEVRAQIVRTTSGRSNADEESLSRNNTGPLGATMVNEGHEAAREEKKEEPTLPEWDELEKEVPTARLWHFQKQNACWFFASLIAAVPAAATAPFIGRQFGNSIGTLMQPPATLNTATGKYESSYSEDAIWKTVVQGCMLYIIVAFIGFFSVIISQAGLRRCSEGITRGIRRETLKAMLRQDQSYHDRYTSGQLADRLAHEAAQIKSFAGESLGGLLSLISTIGVSICIALAACWQLAIAVVILTPLLMVGQAVQMKMMMKKNETRAGPVVSEAMGNIRTVAAFGLGSEMEKKYGKVLAVEGEEDRRQGWVSACSQGYNAFVQFFMYGAVVLIASIFIDWLGIDPQSVFQVFFTLVFSVGGALQGATTWAGDKAKGQHAVKHIFNTLDRVPAIDAHSDAGGTIPEDELKGRITFRNVEFAYPTQTATKVFRDFSLDVEPGKMYAFVGPSGSGKSTTVRLVLRFYDPSSGSVALDGRDLKTLNVKWLRSKMSWVQQEPILFGGSIKTNIQYGAPEGTTCEQADVEQAAREANAHDFIMSFPKRYDEEVGDKGTQLSGGQKQRIAIARCLVRKPKILLLDEATSALDAESERLVQEALDKVLLKMKATTLVIAHRLATIQNADQICVIADGAIVETGKHGELMAKPDGQYRRLAARQAM